MADKKKLGAVVVIAAGAIATAIAALDRGDAIDCSEDGKRRRLENFGDRLALCVKREEAECDPKKPKHDKATCAAITAEAAACVARLDTEFNRTLEACKKP